MWRGHFHELNPSIQRGLARLANIHHPLRIITRSFPYLALHTAPSCLLFENDIINVNSWSSNLRWLSKHKRSRKEQWTFSSFFIKWNNVSYSENFYYCSITNAHIHDFSDGLAFRPGWTSFACKTIVIVELAETFKAYSVGEQEDSSLLGEQNEGPASHNEFPNFLSVITNTEIDFAF